MWVSRWWLAPDTASRWSVGPGAPSTFGVGLPGFARGRVRRARMLSPVRDAILLEGEVVAGVFVRSASPSAGLRSRRHHGIQFSVAWPETRMI